MPWGTPTVTPITHLLAFALLIPTFVLVRFAFDELRTRPHLRSWEDRSGFLIVGKQRRWLRVGPFLATASRQQVVYRLTLLDEDSRRRTAWACCGSWWGGVVFSPSQLRVILND